MKGARGVINPVPSRLRDFAKAQRSAMPRAEALFWEQVRAGRFEGLKFRRQVPVGPFIADFLCASARLVIELDGPVHDSAERRDKDAARDAWLAAQGFRVLRFPNDAVLGNCDQVLDAIRAQLR